MTSEKTVFGIFQGGGAKGIAHLGAWAAAEEAGLTFVSVAGASAGAIVATLIAAGYGAREVMDPAKKGEDLLSKYGTTPTELLGNDDWDEFHEMHRRLKRLLGARSFRWGFVQLLWCACHLFGRKRAVGDRVVRKWGYFSTEHIRNFVNRVLHDRLREIYSDLGRDPDDVPARITFGHLDEVMFELEDTNDGALLPLKIVATNLKRRELEIFGSFLTPWVEVGEAVAASVAIPVVFEPVSMQSHPGGLYADGGLISNLPTWVFLEEKASFERSDRPTPSVPIIGFALEDPQIAKPPEPDFPWRVWDGLRRALRWVSFGWLCRTPTPLPPKPENVLTHLAAVVRTAIFGSQVISQKFIEDLKIISVHTQLEMLDFDAGWPKLCVGWQEGHDEALVGLTAQIITKPELVVARLEQLVELIVTKINEKRASSGRKPLLQARGNVVERFGARSFRVIYGFNMEDDADDRLILDARNRGAALAFQARQMLGQDLDLEQPIEFMSKYEQAQLRQGLKFVICAPIFPSLRDWENPQESSRNEPLGVFCFDSDESLEIEYKDSEIRTLIATESLVLGEALKVGV